MIPTLKRTGRLVRATGRKCFSSPGEALLLLRMAWWVAILSGAVKLCSLPRALELVSGRTSPPHDAKTSEIPDHLARSIDLLLSADVLFIKPICWKRAAVLHRYLSKQGFATKIMFGVKPENKGKVSGHAWLELNGQPILENSPPEYVVTYVFPPDGRSASHLAFLPSE
jgi:Transglutaminase-like superfamily